MIATSRKLLILAGCLGMAGLLILPHVWPGGGNSQTDGEAAVTQRLNADCQSCHNAVWSEWSASPHADAWVSDEVQGAFGHFGHDRQCESCHAPQPVFQTGLSRSAVLRAEDRGTGVNCVTCHGVSDGRVAARRTLPDAPCQPVETVALAASEHCAVCHTAIYEDWEASPYRTEGRTCHDCHLPPSEGRDNGRSHACVGSKDARMIRSGAQMTCEQVGQELVVAVHNHATGHNFPGERHNRVLLLQVIQRSPDGAITLSEQRTIKAITPFRGESSAEQIRARETFTARFPVVQPPVTADVCLLYKAFPWFADRDALIVHRELVELKEW